MRGRGGRIKKGREGGRDRWSEGGRKKGRDGLTEKTIVPSKKEDVVLLLD